MFEEQVRTGQYIDSNIKFADFAEIWLNDYAIPQLRPSTVDGYKRNLARLNAHIGHIRLDKLQPHNITACYKAIETEGKLSAPKYRAKILLKPLLKEKNITRLDISEKYGIGKRTVDTAVSGKAINEKTALAISKALKKPIKSLFEISNEGGGELTGNYMLHLHRLLSSVLEKAVKWQVLLYNPCRRV